MSEDAGAGQGYVSTELFGGAMEADMPVGFGDVSNLRPVPSHQEIYLSNTGFTSVAIDITERVSPTTITAGAGAARAAAEASDRDALKFHFEDIVNTGDESRVWDIEEQGVEERRTDHFGPSTPILTLKATTTTPSSPPTTTVIILTLIRLIPQSTDLIITINVPLHPAALSSFSSSSSSSLPNPPPSDGTNPTSAPLHKDPFATTNEQPLTQTVDVDDDDGDRMDIISTENENENENANASTTADANASIISSDGFANKVFGKDTVQAALVSQGEKIGTRVIASLRVRDWGLFGGT